MSWWTDVRDQTLNNLGVDTGQNAANTAGAAVMDLLKSPAAVPPSSPAATVSTVSSVQAKKVVGLSIPILIAAGLAVYLLMRKK